MIRAMRLAALLAVALLTACASGPELDTLAARIPPVAPDASRIWFYRQAVMFGDGIQPDILLNGKMVGKAQPDGVFFVDAKPGPCDVAMQTEVTRHLTFEAAPGGQTYVRTEVEPGVLFARVYPNLVDPLLGSQEIRGLHFTGTLPARPAPLSFGNPPGG